MAAYLHRIYPHYWNREQSYLSPNECGYRKWMNVDKKTISKTTSAKFKSRRYIKFDDSSSEDELPDMKDIVEDDYLDDLDPMKSFLD
ncbi:hypothetical protein JTE90_026709 [Oedothorax gibbosus]|uniref:Uncharacterized protein n=1 Tax=Oedothorax gibbosus TaxID=931172 RepID=A0AAV6V3A5_9ARAC|nr:hypothetical protein JTE90_026709 [Oedothorax gibbosus]